MPIILLFKRRIWFVSKREMSLSSKTIKQQAIYKHFSRLKVFPSPFSFLFYKRALRCFIDALYKWCFQWTSFFFLFSSIDEICHSTASSMRKGGRMNLEFNPERFSRSSFDRRIFLSMIIDMIWLGRRRKKCWSNMNAMFCLFNLRYF